MKKVIYCQILVILAIIYGNSACNSASQNTFSLKEQKPIRDFVKAYHEYNKTEWQDTTPIFLMFANTNINKTQYYIRANRGTSFIEKNPPSTCFEVDSLLIFLYTGLEKTFSMPENPICHLSKDREPLVYDPPTLCMTILGDSILIDNTPPLADREEATDQPKPIREHIKFIPPKSTKTR